MVTKVARIVSSGFVVLISIMAAALIVPRILGYTPYTVLSGSMEPQYPIGSVVYVQQVNPDKVRENDVVMYRLANGVPVTHRVVAVDSAQRSIITKGDANPSDDIAPIPLDTVVGKAVMCLPLLGYAALFVQTIPGLLCIALITVAALLLPKAAGLLEGCVAKHPPKPKTL